MKTLSPFPQARVTTILRSVAMNGTTSVSPCKWTHAAFVSLWLGDCSRLNVHTVTRAGIAFHVKAAPLYVSTSCGFFIHPSTDTSFPLLGCYALCCYDAIVQTSLQVLLSVPPNWPKSEVVESYGSSRFNLGGMITLSHGGFNMSWSLSLWPQCTANTLRPGRLLLQRGQVPTQDALAE